MSGLRISRDSGESFTITHLGKTAIVHVIGYSYGDGVQLRIEAPAEFQILRSELIKDRKSLGGGVSCYKCTAPSYTIDGLCFRCQQKENGE